MQIMSRKVGIRAPNPIVVFEYDGHFKKPCGWDDGKCDVRKVKFYFSPHNINIKMAKKIRNWMDRFILWKG